MAKKPILKETGRVMAGRLSEYNESGTRHTFARLLGYFLKFPGRTILSLLMAAYENLVDIAKPFILMLIIDKNLVPGRNDMGEIVLLSILYGFIVVTGLVAAVTHQLVLTSLGQRIMHKLRTELFAHIQRLNMKFFDNNASGSILTRVSSDVESLNSLYSSILVDLVKEVMMLVTLLVTMFSLSWQLTLVALGALPFITVLTVFFRTVAKKNFVRVKAQLSRLNGFMSENIIGMKVVQIFHREKEKRAEFKDINDGYYKLGVTEAVLNSLGNSLIPNLAHMLALLMMAFFATELLNGTILVGVMYSFITYTKQLYQPIAAIAQQYTSIASAIVSADRIFDITDKTEFDEDMESGFRGDRIRGEIEFRNVWFAYIDENWVLKDVSFRIGPGERAAFVGATGSGKTTVISLIARFYEIQKGQILLDGRDIREYNLEYLRQQIAVVMQDVFLFSGDIAYNIRLNRTDITDEDIRRAAVTANADTFISRLPDGYHHPVGERGMSFSSGQRQLIAFARAVAFNPAVLVLDEATANIDVETEAAITDALGKISSGRTSIYIAHRRSPIVDSDRIFVLHRGELRESGTHEELLEKGGIYARLYSLSLQKPNQSLGGAAAEEVE